MQILTHVNAQHQRYKTMYTYQAAVYMHSSCDTRRRHTHTHKPTASTERANLLTANTPILWVYKKQQYAIYTYQTGWRPFWKHFIQVQKHRAKLSIIVVTNRINRVHVIITDQTQPIFAKTTNLLITRSLINSATIIVTHFLDKHHVTTDERVHKIIV